LLRHIKNEISIVSLFYITGLYLNITDMAFGISAHFTGLSTGKYEFTAKRKEVSYYIDYKVF
jgi:hypothetical protein